MKYEVHFQVLVLKTLKSYAIVNYANNWKDFAQTKSTVTE